MSQNRSNCLLNIMIIKKKPECNSIFFMILCMKIIVGGMARFSPALIYRRFIFETRSGGVCWLSLPIMRIFGVHMRCPSPPFNHLIKKLILLKLETKTYSTTWLGLISQHQPNKPDFAPFWLLFSICPIWEKSFFWAKSGLFGWFWLLSSPLPLLYILYIYLFSSEKKQ